MADIRLIVGKLGEPPFRMSYTMSSFRCVAEIEVAVVLVDYGAFPDFCLKILCMLAIN